MADTWTVDLDVSFPANTLESAIAQAHAVAEFLVSQGFKVHLGEDYRKEEEDSLKGLEY